jgi:5-methylcytosine-specific restriction endonuclease McrA
MLLMAAQGNPSRRSRPLPPFWAETRARILARDYYRCQWYLPDGRKCGKRATEVDHKIPAMLANDHRDANLQALCHEHHASKTGKEARAARGGLKGTRPPEPHPGKISGAD